MVTIKNLDNGICVVGEENDFVRTISLGIWIKNGSIDETVETSGISHFIEHMLFKGTSKRSAKDIADEMSEIGGRLNAFTGKEYMCYYAHVLDNHFDVAVDILSDMICNSVISDVEIEREKGVILEEIKMCEDSPEDIVNDILEEGIFQSSSLGYNVLGSEETVRGFTRDHLVDYLAKHYVSENIVISVVGKMDFDQVIEMLNEKFKSIPNQPAIQRNKQIAYHPVFVHRDKDFEQVHICMAFPCGPYDSDEMYVLSILNTVLGGGINSRLFQSIREEKGLAYSIYSYPENYDEIGVLVIYAAANPSQIEEVIEAIRHEITKFLTEELDEKELLRTKEQLKSNLIIGLESMNSRMSNNGKSQLVLNKIKSQDEIIDNLNQVDKDTLIQYAKQILDIEKMSVSIVGNFEEINLERIKELCKN